MYNPSSKVHNGTTRDFTTVKKTAEVDRELAGTLAFEDVMSELKSYSTCAIFSNRFHPVMFHQAPTIVILLTRPHCLISRR